MFLILRVTLHNNNKSILPLRRAMYSKHRQIICPKQLSRLSLHLAGSLSKKNESYIHTILSNGNQDTLDIRLSTCCLQGLSVTLLRLTSIVELHIAEAEGFEPSVHSSRTTVFKTVALNHSATPPILRCQ